MELARHPDLAKGAFRCAICGLPHSGLWRVHASLPRHLLIQILEGSMWRSAGNASSGSMAKINDHLKQACGSMAKAATGMT